MQIWQLSNSGEPFAAEKLQPLGSVRFLSYSMDGSTFLALGLRNGGEIVGSF